MKNITVCIIMLMALTTAHAQNPTPAGEQTKRILILGATAHIGDGTVIGNSAIGFEKGKLKLVADATTIRVDRTAYDTIINANGRHVYPGLIALNTTIGLNEIESIRATQDITETGSYNPSARALVAYNTDSKVTPTVRSNGVLLAQITPQGGIVSGQSSVVTLDAWNFEDAAYASDEGIHLNWPSMRTIRSRRADADEKQKEHMEKTLSEIRTLFADAKAYSSAKSPVTNQHLEAMRGLFDGSKSLYVHCNYVKEIIAAAGLCRDFNVRMVLVGGADAWMVTDLLKQQDIAVVITETHRLPSREDEAIDMPFKLPAILESEGVRYAVSTGSFWQVRNLPFQSGQAGGHGLTKEQVLTAVTQSPARILRIDDRTGTLETGKEATLLITGGDLFDMKSSNVESAFIAGRQISLDNIQKQLNEKYSRKYGF